MIEQTVHCRQLLTPQGWVHDVHLEIDSNGVIQAVTKALPGDVEVLEGAVIPGMPNVHSHAFQRAMAGLAGTSAGAEDSFWTWRNVMYSLANRITPGQLEKIAAWLQVEMLQGGYTSCAEFHYLHHQPGGKPYDDPAELSGRILAAAERSGIPVTLLPVLYCRAGFDQTSVTSAQSRFAHTVDSFLNLFACCQQLPGIGTRHALGVAPHSLRAVSCGQLDSLVSSVKPDAAAIHIHVSEQPEEVRQCLSHLGSRPLQYLLDHQPVDSQWCLVHATHLDDKELIAAAGTGAAVGLCPTTEADLGDGLFRINDWLAADGVFGIGSDSNLRLSAAEELRMLEHGARLASNQRNVLSQAGRSCGGFAWQHAARSGAAAIGQPVGQIAPGFRADLVEIETNNPLFSGLAGDELLNAFVFAGSSKSIRSVWVAGQRLVYQDHHDHQEAIEREFKTAIGELRT